MSIISAIRDFFTQPVTWSEPSPISSPALFEDVTQQLSCPSVNPVSGLPMVNCTIDVAGNVYGTDSHMMDSLADTSMVIEEHHTNLGLNPASGLPMMDDSMLDVAGNLYGFDNSHIDTAASPIGGMDDWHNSFTDTSSFDSGNGFGNDW